MKYMEKGGFKQNPLMRLTLSFSLLFLVFFWLTNFAMYFVHMSLRPQSVIDYYCGNDATFQTAKSFEGLAEVSHFHFPMMAIVVLVLTHLIIFCPWKKSTKVSIIVTAFVSAFCQELSSWLVRFVSPQFALLKVVGFVLLQSTLGIMLVALGAYLWFWDQAAR